MWRTYEGNEAVGVIRVALVAHHLLVGAVEGAATPAAGAAGVAGQMGGAVKPLPTQSQAAPEAS